MKKHMTLASVLLLLAILAAGCQKDALLKEELSDKASLEFRTAAPDFDLYVLNPKTGETMQLSHIPNCGEFDPSFSHDTRFVAHDAFFDPEHHIYVTDVQTKESKLLPGAEGGNDPSWSPNGKWIVFTKTSEDGGVRIYRIYWEGGIAEPVTDGCRADWSPDNKMIVFERNGIYTRNLETGEEKYLCPGSAPVWSPDGTTIAYCRAGQLFLIPVDETGAPTGASVQLTNCTDPVGKPSWSSNSKMIAFFSGNETDSYDIWRVRVEDGVMENLTNTPDFNEIDPDWSPNGRVIVFSKGSI
ncbi:MAG: PD40 domain-containing protein [Lewinellaceae bacterium]|nr:PD40 domain-containing protein [Lewinellaceae bacterium]